MVSPELFEAQPALLILGMMCALVATALWLHLALWLGLPVSTTHSVVGAIAGFGLVSVGWRGVRWGTMGNIVASWFISPVAGFVLAFIVFNRIVVLVLHRPQPLKAAIFWGPWDAGLTMFVVALSVLYKGMDHFFRKIHVDFGGWRPLAASAGVAVLAGGLTHLALRRKAGDLIRLSLPEQLKRVEKLFAPLAAAHGAFLFWIAHRLGFDACLL